jgi:outer membrane murein-binding lipoprotein Lpp
MQDHLEPCQGCLCSAPEVEDLNAQIKELERRLNAVSLENKRLRAKNRQQKQENDNV